MGQFAQPNHRDDSLYCGADLGVDWGFGGATGWRMTELACSRWEDTGPISERGREVILKYFGLEHVAGALPLEVIAPMSPDILRRLAPGVSVAA
ncbi:MAG: hypothetical protein ACYCZ0_04580 [Minisyncoccota bacterium]